VIVSVYAAKLIKSDKTLESMIIWRHFSNHSNVRIWHGNPCSNE